VLPLWTSTLVRSYAWVVLLGQDGLVNRTLLALGVADHPVQLLYTRFSVLVGFVQIMLPYFVLPLYAGLTRLDLRLVDAAASSGASPRRAFVSVTLPLSLPSVASGAVMIFILTLGFFVTPALLGGLHEITYVMLIEREVDAVLDWQTASGMAVVFLIFTAVLVALFSKLLGFSAGDPGAGRQTTPAWISRLSVWLATRLATRGTDLQRRAGIVRQGLSWPLRGLVTVILGFVVLPILIFFPLGFSDAPYLTFPPPGYSLRWYHHYFSRSDWINPTLLSFKVAVVTMLLATLIGGMAAVGLSRTGSKGGSACLGLLVSPAIVPQLILAVGLYFELAPLKLIGTATGLVIAHMILAVPLVIIVFLSALRSVDLRPEKAACSLGARPVIAFCKTTLPMLRPTIVSAALFAFLASFDDVVMALFMSGADASTLPKRMWDSVVLEIDPTVAAVSSLMVALSIALFALAQLAQRIGKRAR
jgi:putative spermidine/putrescine transport system permease protein